MRQFNALPNDISTGIEKNRHELMMSSDTFTVEPAIPE